MKRCAPVLTVKALRERRARDAAQLAQAEHRRCQQFENDRLLALQQARESSASLHRAVSTFAGGADEFLVAEAQWRRSLISQQKAIVALKDARRKSLDALQRHQRRLREWAAAREAYRLASERERSVEARRRAISLGAEEADVAETRAVVERARASRAEV